MGARAGSSWDFNIYRDLVPVPTALSQVADIVPVTFADDSVAITPYEYGNAVRKAAMLEATEFTDTHEAFVRNIAKNRAETIELLVRYAFTNGSRVYTYGGVARTSLTRATSAHLLSDDNIYNMVAMAKGRIGKMPDGSYAAVLHPHLLPSILTETAWVTAAQYNLGNKNIDLVTGEVGTLAGVRFVESPWGKVYWGGGAAAHASNIATTTTTTAVAAGDTSVILTTATNGAVKQVPLTALNSANSVDHWVFAA